MQHLDPTMATWQSSVSAAGEHLVVDMRDPRVILAEGTRVCPSGEAIPDQESDWHEPGEESDDDSDDDSEDGDSEDGESDEESDMSEDVSGSDVENA